MVKMAQNKKLIFIIFILIIINVCSCSTDNIQHNSAQTIKTSSSILNKNDELFLKYYALEYNNNYYYTENNSLYKKDKNGNISRIFTENKDFLLIEIIEENLYYEINDSAMNTFKIYKYNLINKTRTILLDSSKNKMLRNNCLKNIIVKNNKFFIQMSFDLFIFDLKDKKLNKCVDDVREFQVVGNQLFFVDSNSNLYKLNLTNKSKQTIFMSNKKINCSEFLIINEEVYFFSRKTQKLYFKTPEELICIDNGDIDRQSLTCYNNELYYILNNGRKKALYKYNKANHKKAKIIECDDYATGIEIIEEHFLYNNSKEELICKKCRKS